MTAQYIAPVLQEVEPPPLLKLSFLFFCIFNLANYSRFFEWHFASAHVPMIASTIALAGAAMEGRLAAVFTSKIGMCMSILTILYAINVPLSTWRSDSLHIFIGDWLKTVVIFAIAGSLMFNIRQCRTACNSIGWGSGIGGILVNWKGEMDTGRLTFGRGTFRNPNALAFDLLLGLPFLWLIVKDPRTAKVNRVLALGLMGVNLIGVLRSGSRGALIGFGVLCLFFFLRSSLIAKLAMVFVGVIAVATVLTVMPNSLKVRYTTIISGAGASEQVQTRGDARSVVYAETSSEARLQLLIKSVQVTMAHPLFGIGLGQFGTYTAGLEMAEGRYAGWQGTHNTYTQISSEAGIPALLVFVSMIVFSLKGISSLSRRAKRLPRQVSVNEILDITFALTAILVIYAVCVFFDYVAYSSTLPILAGISISLIRCGNLELEKLERAPFFQSPDPFLALQPIRVGRPMRPPVMNPASGPSRA